MLNLEKKYFVAPLCENFFSDLGVKNHAPPPPPFQVKWPVPYLTDTFSSFVCNT